MKRSTQLALVSVVGIGAVAYYLNSGEAEVETTDSTLYTSQSDCLNAGVDAGICAAQFGEAYRAHAAAAPRFESKEDCERDFGAGKCEAAAPQGSTATSGSGSYFMPMMMGFMVARMMQGTQPYSTQPLYGCPGGAPGAAGQQCYSSRNGRYVYAYGGSSGSSGNAGRQVKAPVSEFRGTSARYNVVPRGSNISSVSGISRSGVSSRGGFGSFGRGFSGGGG